MERLKILEIGPGEIPVYSISNIVERLKSGYNYFAIDADMKNLQRVADEKPGCAIQGDLAKLPLKDNSVDEIWLMNVFGGLDIRPEKINGSLVYTIGLRRFFEELRRVVRTGGLVNIGEYYKGPDFSKSEFSDIGFEKESFTGSKIWEFLDRNKFESFAYEMVSCLYKNPVFITLKKK